MSALRLSELWAVLTVVTIVELLCLACGDGAEFELAGVIWLSNWEGSTWTFIGTVGWLERLIALMSYCI